MILRSYLVLLAASLMAAPLTAAMAQQNNPTGNLGSNRSSTAAPGTADSKAASGLNSADVGSSTTGGTTYGGAAMNRTTPGATGKTVVPGSTSSQASASKGTAEQKTGGTTGGR